MAGRARQRSVQGDAQSRPAQRPLAPHVQRRRDLDAGQVGISLVCRLGPRLPRARPDARRSRFRQAAAQADAPRAVHAPQRPDSGLRMEFWRRESAGPRLVHDLHLPPGKRRRRAKGTRTGSRAAFKSCLLNFTWWVNRKDRSGRNVFEGGFLGLDNIGVFDRSAPLPTGGYSGAGRRHRLDGPLLPEHAGDRRRAGDDRSRLRRHGAQVLRALPVDRLGDGPRGQRHRHVGRRRRLLLRRAAAARRPALSG